MKRRQIYIEQSDFSHLEDESRSRGVTVSSLIRESIKDRYSSDSKTLLNRLSTVFGIWKDRSFDTEEFIRELRHDRIL